MEMSDEYQDMGNPGGGVAMVNIPITHHQHTPDSPLSHQEEDLSDPDLQDEESGEELLQQPLQGNTHSSPDNASAQAYTPTPLTHLNNLIGAHHPHFLGKLKLEAADVEQLVQKGGLEALQAAMSGAGFNLPFSFPPPAFLTPQHHPQNSHPQASSAIVSGIGNQLTSSASSHSSESSQGSGKNGGEPRETNNHSQSNATATNHQQQTSWSFEEQFKQLYEINDDPKRKEFLDDLFSYMQKRGTPINRLPIMAKSVLDLYELYNLVIARGGLVDVINKKLWQEIIKGLHLPSSITSAAFTLRTQYMKYLYPYECEKRRLSTPAELQAAIDGNRREGRRSSYGTYATSSNTTNESLVQRNPHTPNPLALHAQMSPLSLVTAVAAGGQHHGPQSLMNGSAAHTPLPHHPHHPHLSQGIAGQLNTELQFLFPSIIFPGPIPGMAPSEFEARMVEYVKLLNKELRSAGCITPPPVIHQQDSTSPPPSTPPRDGSFGAVEMSRLTLWNMYNNNGLYPGMAHQPSMSPQASHSPVPAAPTPEPQREALDLGLRSSPICLSPIRQSSPSSGGSMHIRKDQDLTNTPGPPRAKRSFSEDDSPGERNATVASGTHIRISNRGDGRSGDNSLVVSMELNGVTYEGVLFAQNHNRTTDNTPTCSNSNSKPSRSVVL
ncbi:protein dead ringer-like isoform X2 [Bombus flavifrons]|uniref:protein dead ringer-like isoform X2 n=1 Tax=Bombus flavifrons TaxID=103934 RepID=UPI0037039967